MNDPMTLYVLLAFFATGPTQMFPDFVIDNRRDSAIIFTLDHIWHIKCLTFIITASIGTWIISVVSAKIYLQYFIGDCYRNFLFCICKNSRLWVSVEMERNVNVYFQVSFDIYINKQDTVFAIEYQFIAATIFKT